ncbi:hypothetical protein OG799_02220 [Micromonospora sp. NBC_00898]|uniref:hypothetical protein n=1 Tax=Micromonospora sp. NBC_00898 TaxID=2975981 RepID=UPI00386733E9|nr:hypothetical protein OG799_02220 [Micromonospora sp. NBC_00898]
MTSWRRGRQVPGPVPADAGPPSAQGPDGLVGPPTAPEEQERRHEALVGVRLITATPGSHLLDYLRTEPCAVGAWWIAADIDAVVRLSAASLTVLHRAVADLRRRGGAEVVVTHTILRALDLSDAAEPPAAQAAPARVPSPA